MRIALADKFEQQLAGSGNSGRDHPPRLGEVKRIVSHDRDRAAKGIPLRRTRSGIGGAVGKSGSGGIVTVASSG
jgi:hypothetical protein